MQSPSTDELRTILEQELSQHFGAPHQITRLSRRPFEYRTSFPIEELAVDLDDGKHLELIFKNLSWQALSDEVRQVKPSFLHNPLREIAVYQKLLTLFPSGAAICCGVFVDEPRQCYWLFLEKVQGRELYQIGEFETWQTVARWLAEFHGHFTKHDNRLMKMAPFLRYDAAYYRRWTKRAYAFANRDHTAQQRMAKTALAWVAERYEKVIEQLVALPSAFIHGEFYSSNVLVQDETNGVRVCPVDWEMAGSGPGLLDLAALSSGKWSDKQKIALALAYYEAQTPTRCQPISFDEFLISLYHCRLHIAMQWLGWAPNWSPPAENAHDWLGEALELAEKLAL